MIRRFLLAALFVITFAGFGVVVADDPVPECNPCPWIPPIVRPHPGPWGR